MAAASSRQSLRRWGNSLGVRLPAAISREAGLHDNQTVALKSLQKNQPTGQFSTAMS